MNPVALRLLNQQLAAPQFAKPAEVVDYMGAMQAQEYRMMRWAVAMRTKRPSVKAFKTAFDSGQIVRLHLMRGTWQLVGASDYWPLLGLCAPKALATIRGATESASATTRGLVWATSLPRPLPTGEASRRKISRKH